jgi:hypothetical protein
LAGFFSWFKGEKDGTLGDAIAVMVAFGDAKKARGLRPG